MSMSNQEKTETLLELIDILCEMNFSKDTDRMDEWILKLNKVYSNNYRHSYSDIFFKIQTIMSNNADDNIEILEALGENLNVLENRINELAEQNSEDANYRNTLSSFKKFADHIKLEIGRYNFIKTYFMNSVDNRNVADNLSEDIKSTPQKIEKLEQDINAIRPTVTQAQKQLDGLDDKLENNKISSITTLTIFSAVILAFSGGITFESGVFKGMVESSPYRLVFAIALSGFVLFNTIFALLYLVGKMANKKISTRCKYLIENIKLEGKCKRCGDGYCTKECNEVTTICKIIHKYTYVFTVDIILLYILYSDFFLWISEGKITGQYFIASQIFILIVAIGFIIISNIRKLRKVYKIKLYYKVAILQKILEPKGEPSTIIRLGEILSKAFYGDTKQRPEELFINTIQNKEVDVALKELDSFVEEYIANDYRLAIVITKRQHKINKKEFKRLENKFREMQPQKY